MSSAISDFQARKKESLWTDLPISVTVWQPKWQVAENLRKMKKIKRDFCKSDKEAQPGIQ